MRKALRIVDSISEWAGKTTQWLSISLVILVTYEVIMRYVFNKPSLWPFDMACMMGLTLYVLAFAYVLRHKAHVRVDVFYTHLPSRGKAIIDILGALILFFPLVILLTKSSYTWMLNSWAKGETVFLTGWEPPAGPVRTVVAVGFSILALQGLAQFIRDIYLLIKGRAYD